jgi:hypothetical protein
MDNLVRLFETIRDGQDCPSYEGQEETDRIVRPTKEEETARMVRPTKEKKVTVRRSIVIP